MVHEAAASGISGAGTPLPHLATIQQLFGRHDVSSVQAHGDARAAHAAQAMGAEAFATGHHVAFAGPPSLHTAAHEAAHIVQQRGGVQLQAGVGQVGDAYERHADAVADLVVQGQSAEALLDQHAPDRASGTPASGLAIQRTPPPPFSPAIGTKTTTLIGTFGEYTVIHGLTRNYDTSRSPPWGEYKARITLKPNAKTGGHEVAFIQTWRQKDVSTGARVTAANPPNVSAEEAGRMDPKSGMAVDRASPTRDKTPFFGMARSGSGLTEFSTAHKGKFGGDDAFMEDKPGFNDPYEIEFTATATDMTDGTPFDAIGWGFKYDSASRTFAEVTPFIVKAGSEQIAGRDRAYKKWNDTVATSGSGIDKIAIPFDPVTTATTVHSALTASPVDAAKVRTTLLAITDADKQARTAACYEVENGHKLKDDLTAKLSAEDRKGLEAWTK